MDKKSLRCGPRQQVHALMAAGIAARLQKHARKSMPSKFFSSVLISATF